MDGDDNHGGEEVCLVSTEETVGRIIDEKLNGLKELFDVKLDNVQKSVSNMESMLGTFMKQVADMPFAYVPRHEVDEKLRNITDRQDRIQSELDQVKQDVQSLQRWRWKIVGVGTVAGILLGGVADKVISMLAK
jgi:ElaB/YqjD/DUF883 family membrane-anchored ribosome-binding protein